MPIDQILAYLHACPFVPFRLVVTDGNGYEIHHPDLCMPGRGFIVVGIPGLNSDILAKCTVTLSLLHVVRLEPLEVLESSSKA